jgi:two-component system, OmpR family, sensor histidine kinase VanS
VSAVVETDARAIAHAPRRTIRTRLTVTYTLLVLIVAGLLVAGIYVFMRYAPTYNFATGPAPRAPVLTPVPGAKLTTPSVDATLTAFPVASVSGLLNTLLVGSLATLSLLAVIASVAGWLITGRMLRPVREISDAARLAASGRLDHRLALTGPRDELTDLADTFDSMLARLERAFHAQRRFAVNASHELRTPLAATQAVLDVALAESGDATLTNVAGKLRSLNSQSVRIIDTLLDLAYVENTEFITEPVALREMIGHALAGIEAEASIKQIQLGVHVPECRVLGEPTLLAQLVRNLVENGVRHNHAGGVVTVDATVTSGASVMLSIQNTGPVIPPETFQLLTEPFYRGQGRTKRSGDRTSHGLGLALAQAIAAAHGADLVLTAVRAGGLAATVELPLQPAIA